MVDADAGPGRRRSEPTATALTAAEDGAAEAAPRARGRPGRGRRTSRSSRPQIAAALAAHGAGRTVRFRIDERGLVVGLVADDVFFAGGQRRRCTPTARASLDASAPVLARLPERHRRRGPRQHHPGRAESTRPTGSCPRDRATAGAAPPRRGRRHARRRGSSAAGYGDHAPAVARRPPEAARQNRRVDLVGPRPAAAAEAAPCRAVAAPHGLAPTRPRPQHRCRSEDDVSQPPAEPRPSERRRRHDGRPTAAPRRRPSSGDEAAAPKKRQEEEAPRHRRGRSCWSRPAAAGSSCSRPPAREAAAEPEPVPGAVLTVEPVSLNLAAATTCSSACAAARSTAAAHGDAGHGARRSTWPSPCSPAATIAEVADREPARGAQGRAARRKSRRPTTAR